MTYLSNLLEDPQLKWFPYMFSYNYKHRLNDQLEGISDFLNSY